MSCVKCQPFGGYWMKTATGAMARCDCDGSRKASTTERERAQGLTRDPVLQSTDVTIFVEMLAGLLEFFPAESGARIAIGDQIRKMCHSAAEADWLVNRMGTLYKKWPGAREMRMVYCTKFYPLDGVEMIGSGSYPDGIPSEAETAGKAIMAPSLKLLPGRVVSAAKSIDETVLMLAEAKDMKHAHKRAPAVPDIPTLPPGSYVTQADIDAAVNESRERIAREELGL